MKISNSFDIDSYDCDCNDDIEKVSTLCVHAFSLHFYLRDCNAKKRTSIIAVVRMRDERVKFTTEIQVPPYLWDYKNERLKPIDNDCIEINKRISHYRCFIEELCLSLQDVNIVKLNFLNTAMAKSQSPTTVNMERILRDAFRMYYAEQKERGTAKETTIADRQKRLNKLCRIIKEMGVDNSCSFLSNGYQNLKEYVFGYYGGYTSGANGMCELFALLLNYIRQKQEYIKYRIEPITHRRFNVQRCFKTNLLDDEIKALEDVHLDNERENNARYLFLIEAECGSRNSDLNQVISIVKDLDVGAAKAYTETKKGHTAVAVNTDKLQSYISKLTANHVNITCTDANQLLKKIACKANLCRVIESMDNKPLKDCISTHFGRHTFVTNMRRKGYSEDEVIKFTGHSSVDMVKYIYAHLSKEDHEAEALRIISKVENRKLQQPTAPTPAVNKPQRFPTSVDDAKQVLQFLGVETESEDLGELLGLICVYECDILDICKHKIDIIRIKDLFNTDVPIDERCKALNFLIDRFK